MDAVHVWYVRPEPALTSEQLARGESLLAADERARYERFIFDADRRRHLVARVLVRTTLSRYADVAPADWQFTAGPHGRPEIAPQHRVAPIRFSLTHTTGLVALAVTLEHDIGLDVEPRDRRPSTLDIARRFFSPSEADALAALPEHERDAAFLDYWTLKEAYVKATGLGLYAPLQHFSFERSEPPVIRFDPAIDDDPAAWQFARLDLGPDHVAALAIRQSRPVPISCFRTSGE